MERFRSPILIGVLCAIPIALIAAWFAVTVFDPAITDPRNVLNKALDMGPLRGLAFGVGALLAAAILAPRLAREDIGSFGGLFGFVGLAHVFAIAAVTVEAVVRDPGRLELSLLITLPIAWLLTLGPSLIVWLPSAAVWVAAVRRLTVEDLPVVTDLERAKSERMRNEAARDHVIVDATNIADQGSRLYRNRG